MRLGVVGLRLLSSCHVATLGGPAKGAAATRLVGMADGGGAGGSRACICALEPLDFLSDSVCARHGAKELPLDAAGALEAWGFSWPSIWQVKTKDTWHAQGQVSAVALHLISLPYFEGYVCHLRASSP